MARFAALGLGIAGAVIGSFIGAPQIGFLAGSLIGNLLFPPQGPVIEGPRLGDLSVTSSAYGMMRAIGYGTMRMGGNIIWGTPIKEHRHKQKQGKGGIMSGGAATNITYTYTADFFLSFGEGPCEDVLRIWADGKIIYDKTTTNGETSKSTLKFRLYRGTKTQLPDPLIVADKGATLAPAYRDTCGLVFEGLPLADYGNRIPTLTAEVAYKRTSPLLSKNLVFSAGAGGYQRDGVVVDWVRREVYVEGSGGQAAIGTLTQSGQPLNNETVTIGSTVYRFRTVLAAANDVLIGIDAAATLTNLAAAINDDGVEGTQYGTGTIEHPSVFYSPSASTSTTLVVQAKTAGTAGNSIATTETATNYSWGASTLTGGTDGSTTLYTLDLDSGLEKRRSIVRYIDATGATVAANTALIGIGGDGTLAVKGPFSGNSAQISRLDPVSGMILGTFGNSSNGLLNDVNSFPVVDCSVPIVALSLLGPVYFQLTMGFTGEWGLLDWKLVTSSPSTANAFVGTAACPGFLHEGQDVSDGYTHSPICGGIVGAGYGTGYVAVNKSTGIILREVRVQWNAVPEIPITDAEGNPAIQPGAGVSIRDVVNFTVAHSITSNIRTLWFDYTDDSVIVLFENGTFAKVNIDDNVGNPSQPAPPTLIWKTTATLGSSGPSRKTGGYSLINDGRVGWLVLDTSHLYDTHDGSLIVSQANWISVLGDGVFGAQFYNAAINAVVYVGTDGGNLNVAFLDRAVRAGETLSVVVADLCTRAGLAPSDINATALTDIVRGFVVGRQMTARAALEVLAQAFFFDGIESDWTLKFVKRGGAEVAAITEADLIRIDNKSGEAVRESRVQELELPENVSATFYNMDSDYQQGEQHFKRIKIPSPTMYSENKATIQLPIVFTATEVLSIVERALIQAWVERTAVETRMPTKFIALDPGDPFSLTKTNGILYHLRMAKTDMNGDLSVSINAAATDATTYTGTGVVGDGGTIIDQPDPASQSTKLFVLNTPLLRDTDDVARTGGVQYAAGAGYVLNQLAWKGANVLRSYDGNSYFGLLRIFNPVVWGTCKSKLGDHPSKGGDTDRVNTLDVFLVHDGDGLVSVTELAMLTALNGENAAAVGNSVDGWEIIQFRDAVQNADGSWTVSTLLRGRRGTEHYIGGHKIGDYFVLLDADTVDSFGVPLTEQNKISNYKAVGAGQLPEEVDFQAIKNTFPDLMPYSPGELKAIFDIDGNILIDWKRRTRVNGGWKDGGGEVPINEDLEKYDIDIYTSDGTTLRRTVTGLTSPKYTYAKTQLQIDDLNPANRDLIDLVVTNPGAESGPFDTNPPTGWTDDGGTIHATTSGGPPSGTHHFSRINIGGCRYYQDFNVTVHATLIDSGTTFATVKWLGHGGSTTTSSMDIQCYSGDPTSGGALLSEDLSLIPQNSGYVAREKNLAIPKLTRFIRIAMRGTTGGGGSSFWDDIQLFLAQGTTNPTPLRINVFQTSAQVGRGIPNQGSLIIHPFE